MMKKGDIVVCVADHYHATKLKLTEGKKYEVGNYWPFDNIVRLVNDHGVESDYTAERFELLVKCEIESFY